MPPCPRHGDGRTCLNGCVPPMFDTPPASWQALNPEDQRVGSNRSSSSPSSTSHKHFRSESLEEPPQRLVSRDSKLSKQGTFHFSSLAFIFPFFPFCSELNGVGQIPECQQSRGGYNRCRESVGWRGGGGAAVAISSAPVRVGPKTPPEYHRHEYHSMYSVVLIDLKSKGLLKFPLRKRNG